MSEQITVRLPDGSTRALATGTTAAGLAQDIGSRLAKAAVIASVNGDVFVSCEPMWKSTPLTRSPSSAAAFFSR